MFTLKTAHVSGNLNVETGGQFKLYNLGDSHTNTTNTESISLYSSANVNYLYGQSTGTGVVRDLKIGTASNNIWFRSAYGIMAFTADGSPRLECMSEGVLVVNSNPLFPWTDSASLCGKTDKRWLAVNSVDGDFSGSVSGARGFFETSTTTDPTLTITSAVSQTANLQEWRASDDVVIAQVSPDGSIATSGDVSVSGDVAVDGFITGGASGHAIRLASTLVSESQIKTSTTGGTVFAWGWGGTGAYSYFTTTIFPSVDNSKDLGTTTKRWRTAYLYDGSFSNDLNVETGGQFKLYNLGDSHTNTTDTEFISMGWDTNDFEILADKTGTGTVQDIDIAGNQVALKHNNGSNISTRLSVDTNSVKVWRNLYGGTDGLYNCGLPTQRWASVYSREVFSRLPPLLTPTLTVTSAASQTANLQEWRASDDVVIAQVEPDGSIATSGDVSVSGNLVANQFLKFYGGSGPDIYSTASLAYLRNSAGQSRLRWGLDGGIMVFGNITPKHRKCL